MATDDGRGLERLEAWARAVVGAISPATLAAERWSGLRGRTPRSVELVDAFPFADGGILAVVEARPDDAGEPVRLTLPFPDAAPWSGLHVLASQGGEVFGARGGRLTGRPVGELREPRDGTGPPSAIRMTSGDQSHTSVVIDERAILKLYRRLTPGPNAEAEVMGALAAIPDAPVPTWLGQVDLVHPGGQTTAVAIEQGFVAGALDPWELLADGLATWLETGRGPVGTAIPADAGLATGRLHAALAALGRRGVRGFELRPATPDDRAAWQRRGEEGLAAAIRAIEPIDSDLAARLGKAMPAIRRSLRPLGDAAIPVRLQRIHGDLHVGQLLPAPSGMLIVDFEGDPMRAPEERRALGPPLQDVACFLRSIYHVARSGFRRAHERLGGQPGPDALTILDGWIRDARSVFTAGYAAGIGDPAWTPDRALLRALEVEKELGEFEYAARYLPAWLYAPAGGLRALLGAIVEPPPAG